MEKAKMKKEDEFKIKYRKKNYNIYEFLNNHPGGINYVKPYETRDVTNRMIEHDHSQAAYYLLKEYKDGGRKASGSDEEDLEYLVDWNKAMLSQVANLGSKYKDWVISPVDRQLRLFQNPILENLTITPWYVVPLVWIPVIIYFIVIGTQHYVENTKVEAIIIHGTQRTYLNYYPAPFLPAVLNIGLGVLLWTLIEYSLHRWVFHLEPSGRSKIWIYVHFAIHGLHHKVPFDSRRLVFPPFPAAIITFLLYKMIELVFPSSTKFLIMAGGISGYVTYDMIHFYLHHGAPKENSYFYHLKRYHNQHHFAHHDNGFGISSMFWDKIFGTAINLRKLKIGIKW